MLIHTYNYIKYVYDILNLSNEFQVYHENKKFFTENCTTQAKKIKKMKCKRKKY